MKPSDKEEKYSIKGKEEVTVNVGDEFIYNYHQHTSVGEFSSYSISDESIVTLVDDYLVYHHPERMRDPEIQGADGAGGTYVFKAVKSGECIITVNKEFRGDIEKTENIRIIVE